MVKGKVCQKLTPLFGRLSAMVNSLFFPLLSHKSLSEWTQRADTRRCNRLTAWVLHTLPCIFF